MRRDLVRCHVIEATHVKSLSAPQTFKKIRSKYGIDAEGHLAPPSKGGFGVITDDGEDVPMTRAISYWRKV